jgi:PKHD-type hydroxylase
VGKRSTTIALSNPRNYEDADLPFMIHKEIVNASGEKATVFIFPSFIIHKITPMTKESP